MNIDDNSDEVEGRERVDCILNGGEISQGRVLIDCESEGREELVLGSLEHRVVEPSHKINPLHELLLRILTFRFRRPQGFRVRVHEAGQQEKDGKKLQEMSHG